MTRLSATPLPDLTNHEFRCSLVMRSWSTFNNTAHHQLFSYEVTVTVIRSSAKTEAELLDKRIKFFTNRSDRNETVGVAAIQQDREGLTMEKMAYMSNSNVLNSYVAKLYGIHLALQKTCQQRLSKRQNRNYTIAADSHNALQSLVSPKCQSEQFMIRLIIAQVEKLKSSNTHLFFRWVPAHEGVLGNERAHTLASKTTETNGPRPLTTSLK